MSISVPQAVCPDLGPSQATTGHPLQVMPHTPQARGQCPSTLQVPSPSLTLH